MQLGESPIWCPIYYLTTSTELSTLKNFLKTVNTYTLHKKSRVVKHNPSFSRYRRHQFQIDLVDVQKLSKQNNGIRYLHTAIDTFSRLLRWSYWSLQITSNWLRLLQIGIHGVIISGKYWTPLCTVYVDVLSPSSHDRWGPTGQWIVFHYAI